MLLTEDEIKRKIESPLNLMNKLNGIASMSKTMRHPSLPPSAEQLIDNIDSKLSEGSVTSKARAILVAAMDELKDRVNEVQKPERLATIAKDMSTIVSQSEMNKSDRNEGPQIIVYSPQIRDEREFNFITVEE